MGVLAAFFLVLAPGRTAAFNPTNLLTVFGLFGHSHQEITRQAVADVDSMLFDVAEPTSSMDEAIDEIADGNSHQDYTFFTPYRAADHFDSEAFADGQAGIRIDRLLVISSLELGQVGTAREALGEALHAIQDFYAHSNWIELGHSATNPEVGRGGALGNLAGRDEATCRGCLPHPNACNDCGNELATSKLTSGYYDIPLPNASKCSHGGPRDDSAPDGGPDTHNYGINKDTTSCTWSPRHDLHETAALLARQASRDFIHELYTSGDLSLAQMKLLLGAGPTLAFAIDTTGSMGPIIQQVKARAIAIVDDRLGGDDEPSAYVLAPFNDPEIGPVLVTDDPDEFKRAISALGANGGGDCAEPAYAGMEQAISAAAPGGNLFVFTDAAPKDAFRAANVTSLAASRKIKIEPIRFGTCGAFREGQEESEGRWWENPALRAIAPKAFGDDLRDAAVATGGQLFDLEGNEAGAITTLADLVVRSNAVEVARFEGSLAGSRNLAVPIDSSLTQVTFSASGVGSLQLRRPNGSIVQAGDPGVQRVVVSGGVIYSVLHPAAGNWTGTLSGNQRYSFAVSGESSLKLRSFRFVEAGGRDGHEGFFPIEGLPLAGVNRVAVALEGVFNAVAFELRRADGSKVADLPLVQGFGQLDNERSGEVTLPNESVVFVARGTDGAGFPFERVVPAPTRPQPVEVRPQGATPDLPAGGTVGIAFEVRNLGAAATFDLRASDSLGYVLGVSPASVSLAAGASRTVIVNLAVPAEAVAGSSDTLTLVATGASNPAITNFAVISPLVVGGCAANATTLCLGGGHFKVEARWRDFTGHSGSGKVVPGGSADSGVFWFFNASNWELLIKVLDGCALNERYWVFAAATTNVEFTIDVTDTRTGAVKTYFNPLGHRADSITDTGALATCGGALSADSGSSLVRLDEAGRHPGLALNAGWPDWAPRVAASPAPPAASPPAFSAAKPGLPGIAPAGATEGGSSCVAQTIACNSSRTGTIGPSDCALGDGTFYDFFRFDAEVGVDIVATLSSSDFDTFLLLVDPASNTVETDDDGGGGTNSRLTYHLGQSGSWGLAANNFFPGDYGAYTLRLDCSGGAPTLPSAPTNLTAVAVSASRIDLSFTDTASNENEFRVESRTGSGSFVDIGSVPAGSTGAQVTGLAAGTTYQFRVRARNAAGNSGYSNTATATTAGGGGGCVPGPRTLCLNRSRFKVEVVWQDPAGASGQGRVAPLGSADSGIFYFFTPDNWEMLIKVLDGCGLNSRYWVYGAATTTVKFDLVVTDTQTGATRTYSNPPGQPATTILDAEAFATCP